MSVFSPISPREALRLIEHVAQGEQAMAMLADFAEAGLVRGYARLIETQAPGAAASEVRDGRIDRTLWRRIIAEGRVADVFATNSVRLGVGPSKGADVVSIIGIRFDEKSVGALARQHSSAGRAEAVTVERSKPEPRPCRTSPAASVVNSPPARRPGVVLDASTVSVSIADASTVLGLSRVTIYKLIGSGRLSALKVGNRRLVRADSIRAMLV